MSSFRGNLGKWRTFKRTGLGSDRFGWSRAIPVLLALSLLSWVIVVAVARAVAAIL
jgi:hypothetical protein